MTHPIYLNNVMCRDFFIKNGYVYTLGGKKGTCGYTVARIGSYTKWTKIADVYVESVRSYDNTDNYKTYAFGSGFKDPDEWIIVAKAINHSEVLYLYRVVDISKKIPSTTDLMLADYELKTGRYTYRSFAT